MREAAVLSPAVSAAAPPARVPEAGPEAGKSPDAAAVRVGPERAVPAVRALGRSADDAPPLAQSMDRRPGRPRRDLAGSVAHAVLFSAAFLCVLTLAGILAFLVHEGLPLFRDVPVLEFLLGRDWYPTFDPPSFGIFPMLAGSVAVTVVSSLLAVPLGILTAVYLSELAAPRMRALAKPLVEMLQALPSVVIGFFGLVVVAPFLQQALDLDTGLNVANAALMLAFMSVPTITGIAEDALRGVPRELREASLALGATKWQSIHRVVLPAALPGLATAVILGMSRSMGETMVVLMVAGGAALVPGSLFDPVRPMPASIAAEMAETPFRSDHYHALFAIGLALFVFTFLFNALAAWIAAKKQQTGSSSL